MANRPVHIAILPPFIRREGLEKSAFCVVDLLRASTTMVRAIENGATAIRLVTETAAAIAERDKLGVGGALAAGERGGVAPPGFDLGNSPQDFTRERIAGKTIVFTTTNGTKLVTHGKPASLVLIGCLNNRRAVAAALGAHGGPIMIACAGTDSRIAAEDCIGAGGIVEALVESTPGLELSDPALLCLSAWRGAKADASTLLKAVSESTGAKNLIKLNLGADVAECVRVDVTTVVPRWNGEAVVG